MYKIRFLRHETTKIDKQFLIYIFLIKINHENIFYAYNTVSLNIDIYLDLLFNTMQR